MYKSHVLPTKPLTPVYKLHVIDWNKTRTKLRGINNVGLILDVVCDYDK